MSPTEIYAVIGEQICVWNGSSWSPHTDDITGLQPAFHLVAPNDIWAVAGTRVHRWH